ncbi:g11442 [Coccomyxa elongata]
MGGHLSKIAETVFNLLPRKLQQFARGRLAAGTNFKETATPCGLSLPSPVHATLTPEEVGDGRVIVVGDVHGCPLELEALLDKCKFQQGVDKLVSVGDLVNKGEQSAEAVHLVRQHGGITVRGNHDEMALERYEMWKKCGRLDPKYAYLEQFSAEDVEYFRQMPFSLSIPSHGVLVVHAGIVPGTPLEDHLLHDLIEMRHVAAEGSASANRYKALPKFPRSAGQPWANIYNGPQHVIFGHHARRRLQPCRYATGIDTGCVLGDQLTAVVLPPVSELRRRGIASPPTGSVTLESIAGELISVRAKRCYKKEDVD